VTVWGDLAAGLAEQLRKGSAVYCEGRVRLDKWTDKTTGEPRSGLSVSAWRCEVHGAIGRNAPNRERPAADLGVAQKALVPPPTNVGQLPQPSETVRVAWAGAPAFARRT
jgi:single-stranded DNA-binding protein